MQKTGFPVHAEEALRAQVNLEEEDVDISSYQNLAVVVIRLAVSIVKFIDKRTDRAEMTRARGTRDRMVGLVRYTGICHEIFDQQPQRQWQHGRHGSRQELETSMKDARQYPMTSSASIRQVGERLEHEPTETTKLILGCRRGRNPEHCFLCSL